MRNKKAFFSFFLYLYSEIIIFPNSSKTPRQVFGAPRNDIYYITSGENELFSFKGGGGMVC